MGVKELLMIDWHCHILPGLDDGPAEIEQSLAMAAVLSAAGFTTVYCTPHLIRGCYEAGNAEVLQAIAELQQRVNSAGIPLTLLPGREYCLDEYLLVALEDPLPLGNSRQVLVEILPTITADMIRHLLFAVVRSGFTPVIAHPERCQLLEPVVRSTGGTGLLDTFKSLFEVGRRASLEKVVPGVTGNPLLDYLRDLGCSFQGNLGSFSGLYGRQVKNAAETMKALGLYDRYGSDLHAAEHAGRVLQPPFPVHD
jgi:protein-tyrosine phosphatase